MAFLICYSDSLQDPESTHGRRPNKAIYLNQPFYETIFRECRLRSGFPILSEIASLKYKSPTLVVAPNRLSQLCDELTKLKEIAPLASQIDAFIEVCREAVSDGLGLTISGDMYPEL
jgi:hypothetical protein